MSLVRAFAAAAAAALVNGCSTPSGPEPAPLPALDKELGVQATWTANVGTAERFVFMPAIHEGTIFAAGRSGTVTRFVSANGRVLWSVQSLERLSAGVATDGRIAVVANEEGEIMALDAETGAERWRARVSSEVLAPPAIGAGLVVVRTIDNRLFAFGADDGKRRWAYQRASSSLIIRAPAGVVIEGDTAYAGFAGGKLAALALSNGGLRWEATVSLPKGATELERVSDVVGDPAVQGREVCAASYQGRVACFELASGRLVWARDVSSLTGVLLDARYAFVSDEKGAVQAFDRSTGRSVWKQDKLAHRQVSAARPAGEVVAVGDLEGYVHLLERETGAFVGRYATRGGAVRAAPVAVPGGLIVQSADGSLHVLGL